MSEKFPLPKNKEARGEFMKRCTAVKVDPSDSKWSDPNRIVAACEMQWSKAKECSAMIIGSGDSETLFMVNPIKEIKANSEIQVNADAQVANEVFATLLNSATVAHILHLQTRSYAKHKALEDLYDSLPEITDTLIESYQSKYGIAEYPVQSVETPSDALDFVKGLREYVSTKRFAVAKDSELQNITDEIVQLLDSTIYKLTFLN